MATAHQRGLEVMVWVLKEEAFDHVEAWNMLASRGVDLFTSDLPMEAFEWWQQRRELKLLQLKLMKQKQAQRRRRLSVPSLPSSPQLLPRKTVQVSKEPSGALTPPDGSVMLLNNSNHPTNTTDC